MLRNLNDIAIVDPCQINPHLAKSVRQVEELCQHFGIDLPTMPEYTTMSSYLFPYTSLDRLIAIDFLNAVLFYIDDTYDRNVAVLDIEQQATIYQQCVQIFVTGTMPAGSHRLYAVWYELHRRFLQYTTSAFLKRLAVATTDHLQETVVNSEDLGNNSLVEAYIASRVKDSGMQPTVLLIEFAYDLDQIITILDHPVLAELTTITVVAASLMNDLFSYEKEVLRHQSRFNLVALIMEEDRCDFVHAVDRSIAMINDYLNRFYDLAENIPVFGDDELNRQCRCYIRGLRDQLNAAWYWQWSTNRYRSPYSPFPELRTLLPSSDMTNCFVL